MSGSWEAATDATALNELVEILGTEAAGDNGFDACGYGRLNGEQLTGHAAYGQFALFITGKVEN